jgi:hypothetical protein
LKVKSGEAGFTGGAGAIDSLEPPPPPHPCSEIRPRTALNTKSKETERHRPWPAQPLETRSTGKIDRQELNIVDSSNFSERYTAWSIGPNGIRIKQFFCHHEKRPTRSGSFIPDGADTAK